MPIREGLKILIDNSRIEAYISTSLKSGVRLMSVILKEPSFVDIRGKKSIGNTNKYQSLGNYFG